MNDNEQVLAELKRIAAWADMQRKVTKWSLIFVAVFIPAMIIFGVAMEHRLNKTIEDIKVPDEHSWYDVDRNLRNCKADEAIRIGEELIQKTPLSPDGHIRLANAYLTAGDVTKAKTHYAEAVRLFPSEDNHALLNAVNQRSDTENAQAARPYGSPATGSPSGQP